MNPSFDEQVAALKKDWAENPRWNGVTPAEYRRRLEGASTRFEVTWRNASGEHPKTIVSALPLFDADGRYSGSCGRLGRFARRYPNGVCSIFAIFVFVPQVFAVVGKAFV